MHHLPSKQKLYLIIECSRFFTHSDRCLIRPFFYYHSIGCGINRYWVPIYWCYMHIGEWFTYISVYQEGKEKKYIQSRNEEYLPFNNQQPRAEMIIICSVRLPVEDRMILLSWGYYFDTLIMWRWAATSLWSHTLIGYLSPFGINYIIHSSHNMLSLQSVHRIESIAIQTQGNMNHRKASYNCDYYGLNCIMRLG